MHNRKNKSWKQRVTAFILGLLVLPAVLMMQSLMNIMVYQILGTAPTLAVNAVPVTLILILLIGIWYRFETGYRFHPVQAVRKVRRAPFYLAAVGIGTQGISSLMMIAIQILLPKALEDYEQLLGNSGMGTMSLPIIIYTVLLAPIVEELIFRGLIHHYFEKAGCAFWIANLLQAVLFGIYHLNLAQGICAGMIGLLIGYAVRKYDTLAAGIMLHIVFNIWGYGLMLLSIPDSLGGALLILELMLAGYGLGGMTQMKQNEEW
ncbi:MAG: lysostaphin resistance A-like protein [Bariatricus sp.]